MLMAIAAASEQASGLQRLFGAAFDRIGPVFLQQQECVGHVRASDVAGSRVTS